jgi:hypothetical protein
MRTLQESVAIIHEELDNIRLLAEDYPRDWSNIELVREKIDWLASIVINEQSRLFITAMDEIVYRHYYGFVWIARDSEFQRIGKDAFFKVKRADCSSSLLMEYLKDNPEFYKLCIQDSKDRQYRMLKEWNEQHPNHQRRL